jgi:hypothetical protein
MRNHLLIISCSNKKDTNPGLLPAIERYKGAWYGVINKLKRTHRLPNNLDIIIISAKYGFIDSNQKIHNYDQKIDSQRAKELNPSIMKAFSKILSKHQYKKILINLGSEYMKSIAGFEKLISRNTNVTIIRGRIGERKRDMKKWIETIE